MDYGLLMSNPGAWLDVFRKDMQSVLLSSARWVGGSRTSASLSDGRLNTPESRLSRHVTDLPRERTRPDDPTPFRPGGPALDEFPRAQWRAPPP